MKGATQVRARFGRVGVVSIHAPREGRDGLEFYVGPPRIEFQSTRPVKGATKHFGWPRPTTPVSIHAPREGRDIREAIEGAKAACFNPRAP